MAMTRGNKSTTLQQAELALEKAAAAKDVEGALSHFAEQAVLLPPHTPAIRGKGAIRSVVAEGLATPGFSLRTEVTRAETSRSGDLGYTMVNYEVRRTGPAGKPTSDRGRLVRVWEKRPDASWKVTVEIWNSDQPAPTQP